MLITTFNKRYLLQKEDKITWLLLLIEYICYKPEILDGIIDELMEYMDDVKKLIFNFCYPSDVIYIDNIENPTYTKLNQVFYIQ